MLCLSSLFLSLSFQFIYIHASYPHRCSTFSKTPSTRNSSLICPEACFCLIFYLINSNFLFLSVNKIFMGWKLVYCVVFLYLLDPFVVCSGSSVNMKKAIRFGSTKNRLHREIKQQYDPPPSPTSKKDVTNPITTVPTIIPAPFASTIPVMNPTSNPESAPPTTVVTPINYPPTVTAPPSLSSSWCIASQSVSQTALQVALDYACGYGGADCSAIQGGGNCYYPNTVRDHASYAFNQYYQRNPTPTSCNFGGTAVVTSTDPSRGTCQYPSTSTSSSILNTTNSSGATVFGAVPSGPTPTTSAAASSPTTRSRSPSLPSSLLMVSVSALLYRLFRL